MHTFLVYRKVQYYLLDLLRQKLIESCQYYIDRGHGTQETLRENNGHVQVYKCYDLLGDV